MPRKATSSYAPETQLPRGTERSKGDALRRVNLFLKGNLDVRDSLHSLRLNGKLEWNGVNEIVRAKYPGTVVQVRHETWTRSDALLEAAGKVPHEVAHHALPLTGFPAS